MLVYLGLPSDRAQEAALAIDDWRKPAPQGSPFDLYYSSRTPSFRASHASFQEIEELLLVKGITPDLLYGTYVPTESAQAGAPGLAARDGLADCLSVFGTTNQVDANTAAAPTLAAVGLPPDAIQALLARRRMGPLNNDQLHAFLGSIGAASGRLRIGANSIIVFRGTARLRLENGALSDLKRTVAAKIKYMPSQYNEPINYLRWYDNAWSH